MVHATVHWVFGEPSTLTNNLLGRYPMIFGAMRLRYSINIRARCGGISKATSLRFFTSLAGNSKLEIAPGPSRMNKCTSKVKDARFCNRIPRVTKNAHRERSLRLHESPEIGLGVALHFGPESPGKLVQAPQYRRIIELSQGALVLFG